MNANIEQRIKSEDLGVFTLSDPKYFTSFESYNIRKSTYYDLLLSLLPDSWTISRRSCWYIVNNDWEFPKFGFKIHISLIPEQVEKALPIILPILIDYGLPFKMLVDEVLHSYFNSRAINRASGGKFITIYPRALESFRIVIERLYKATEVYYGPFILSDKPYKDSRCIFYRYGAFVGNPERNILGSHLPVVINEQRGINDERTPYFQLPEGVKDPFDHEIEYPKITLLNDRYEVKECISNISNKGGIYIAEDVTTKKKVVLKEARPYVNLDHQGRQDAIAGLKHEERLLIRLEGTGVCVKRLDSFYEWDHYFLVLEYFDWSNLRYVDHGYLTKINQKQLDDLTQFCRWYLTVLENLIEAVKKVHDCDIVIGDLAPQNVLMDKTTLEIRLVDLEGGFDEINGEFYKNIASLGFTDPNRIRPFKEDDWEALSAFSVHLMHPIIEMFALNTQRKDDIIEEVFRYYNLPGTYGQLPKVISRGYKASKALLKELSNELDQLNIPLSGSDNDSFKSDFSEELEKIQFGVLQFIENPLKETFFPLDHRGVSTGDLGVAYGISGVFHFLRTTLPAEADKAQIEQVWLDQIKQRELKFLPPGLYIGLSGVAWLLNDAGHNELASAFMQKVYSFKLRDQNADFFYGAAGWGMASLYFYRRTDQIVYLERAQEAARIIRSHLDYNGAEVTYRNMDGAHYSGLMHGSSGIALFFLRLYEVTGKDQGLQLARTLIDAELAKGEYAGQDLTWKRDYNLITTYPYLHFGAAGIGSVVLRFYQVLNEATYLDKAKEIASGLMNKFCLNPGLLLGMSGIGHYFLDMWNVTRDDRYMREAHSIANRVILYGFQDDNKMLFPGEELLRYSSDLATGASGIGLFLWRLQNPEFKTPLFLDLI